MKAVVDETLSVATPLARAAGESAAGLDRECWADAFLIRAFERRLLRLFSEGRLSGTVHTCVGQELTGVAVARSLGPLDVVFSTHRCHGHYLARTRDVDGLMAEIMGRAGGVSGGRGGSQHVCAHGFFSNGVQGGFVPVAAGMAMAKKLRRDGRLAVVFIGDGTLGEGVVYETLNLASRWELPLALVLENNLYAQSTSQHQALAGDILLRAEAFGIRTFHADVWEPEALFRTVAEAFGETRGRGAPVFICVDAYRLLAHSKGDDYRDREEVKRYWAKDPLVRFAREFQREAKAFEEEAESRVAASVARAEESAPTCPEPNDDDASASAPRWRPTKIRARGRVVSRIYTALRSNMERDARALCIGEDIEAPYGGAFKVTGDLSKLFPGRVRNTPISESAIVGLATGLAMDDYRPVVEIMFGDFLTLAADQFINHAAKLRYLSGGEVRVPVVIRAPVGGGGGYGPTHSQCLEKHLFGVPDTRVLALHPRYDPALVYERLFATIDRPTLVLEHKLLYGEYISDRAPDGFTWEHTEDDFPTSRLRPGAVPDLTIVCYGGLLGAAERAADALFEEHEIVAEVVCPIELYPLRLAPLLESVRRSGRLLVVEEGQLFSGFGSEVIAEIHGRAPGLLVRSRRLGPPACPVPSAKSAELKMLPSLETIVGAAVALTRE
jgi:2-oxoisovalerate dehydrogenase E1 component